MPAFVLFFTVWATVFVFAFSYNLAELDSKGKSDFKLTQYSILFPLVCILIIPFFLRWIFVGALELCNNCIKTFLKRKI